MLTIKSNSGSFTAEILLPFLFKNPVKALEKNSVFLLVAITILCDVASLSSDIKTNTSGIRESDLMGGQEFF